MATRTKSVICDFYQCDVISSSQASPQITVDSVFKALAEAGVSDQATLVKEIKSINYEARVKSNTAFGYEGVALKYRIADLPNAAIPGGAERAIDLKVNEQLVEKCYFAYHSDFQVLILQRNFQAVSPARFGEYLTANGYTVSLNPIIDKGDLARLMKNSTQVMKATFTIAKPTNHALFSEDKHDLTNSIVKSMGSVKAAVVKAEYRGNAKSKIGGEKYLDSCITRVANELIQDYDVRKAKLQVEDETGMVHAIDLVANRLVYTQKISVQGRNPDTATMKDVLASAREAKEDDLVKYFGGEPAVRLR